MVKLVFYGSKQSETDDVELVAYCNVHNEIFIEISSDYPAHIVLDKQTAIKFSKELRKQIASIEDDRLD